MALIGASVGIAAPAVSPSYGARAQNVLLFLTNINDAETFSIGANVFETDMHPSNRITSGRIRIDLTTNGTQASGVLTFTNQPENGDAFTVNGRTYTFKTTIAAEGDVKIAASKAASITNLFSAINDVGSGAAVDGTDWYATTGHSNVYGASLTTGALTLKARAPGMEGNAIAFSRAWATNIGMGAATTFSSGAGPNPATDPFLVTNIVRTINQSNTMRVQAEVLNTNQIAIFSQYAGTVTHSNGETFAGASWGSSFMYGGRNSEPIGANTMSSRIPTANEVTAGLMTFYFPFPITAATAIVRGTNGVAVAWDGAVFIGGSSSNKVTLDNVGSTDWAQTSRVTVNVSP